MTKRELYEAIGQLDAAYCRQALQSGSEGEEGFMSNTQQPLWQRVTTGLVAAAACTVFVGGGVFIAQQAMQTQDVGTPQRITNFLGGSGEIRVAGTDMNLMYDDTNIYLYGFDAAARGGDAAITQVRLDDEQRAEMMHHIRWDGEQFYYWDETGLYRMDAMGNREDTPFYTISDADRYALENSLSDYHIEHYYIQKLTADYYVINFFGVHDTEMGGGISMALGNVYQPESGEQVSVPEGSVLEHYLSDGENHYYTPASKNGGLYQVQLDTSWTNKIETNLRMSSDGWTVADNHLYYMGHPDERGDELSRQYNKLNLDTCAVTTVIDDAPFMQFCAYEGRLYAIENDRYLVCSNPEWTETETLFSFTDEMLEPMRQMMQETMPADQAEEYVALKRVLAVDENYVLIEGNYYRYYALLDRQNGTVQFIYLADGQADEQTETAPPEEEEPLSFAELELHADTIPMRSLEEAQALTDAARAEYAQNPHRSVIDTAPYIATFMEPYGDPQAAQEWLARVNTLEYKSYLYHMMLNSIDYFNSAQGTMVNNIGMNEMESEEDVIEFQVNQQEQRFYECTYRDDELFAERFGEDGMEYTIDRNTKKYVGARIPASKDFVISDNDRVYTDGLDTPTRIINRPIFHTMGFADSACLFPQAYAMDRLNDFNYWEIIGTDDMFGRTCAVIRGYRNRSTFWIYVDVATGIMMKYNAYEEYEENGQIYEKLTEYAEVRSLEVDTDFEVKRFDPEGCTPMSNDVPVPNTAE